MGEAKLKQQKMQELEQQRLANVQAVRDQHEARRAKAKAKSKAIKERKQ
jgi:hypothetical protein